MPWEKSFDMEEALDSAMAVFWAKGYEGTSMADLLDATGLNKGSLYNAFGNKQALFTKAFLKYDRLQRAQTLKDLAAMNDPVKAVGLLFDGLIEQSAQDSENKGCFLVNTATDLPNQDADIQAAVKAGLQDMEAFFSDQIVLGQKTGAIPKSVDKKMTARGLLTLVTGLRVFSRGIFNPQDLQFIKRQALALIGH